MKWAIVGADEFYSAMSGDQPVSIIKDKVCFVVDYSNDKNVVGYVKLTDEEFEQFKQDELSIVSNRSRFDASASLFPVVSQFLNMEDTRYFDSFEDKEYEYVRFYNSEDVFITGYKINKKTKKVEIDFPEWAIKGLYLETKIISEDKVIGDTASIISVDGGQEPFVFSIVSDKDNKFTIIGNEIKLKNNLVYSEKSSHEITIVCTDANQATITKTFNLLVGYVPLTVGVTKSINFDGVDDKISFAANSPALQLEANLPFTISFLIYKEAADTGFVFEKRVAAQGYRLRILTSAGVSWFTLYNSNGGYIQAYVAIPDNVWTHVIITYDGSGTKTGLNAYSNGNLHGSKELSGSFQSSDSITNNDEFIIGNGLFGKIDNFVIFDKVLSGGERALLLNNKIPHDLTQLPFAQNITFYLPLGDGDSLPIVNDVIGKSEGSMLNMDDANIVEEVSNG